jgi:hypothetical protein
MMLATGMLFLSKTAPLVTRATDGTFCLTLLAFDRIAPQQVEPWRINWAGMAAESFWLSSKGDLKPGQPITVALERIRTFTNGRHGGAESHAQAVCIQLAQNKHALRLQRLFGVREQLLETEQETTT